MTLSLKSRIIGALPRALRRYTGMRDLDSVIATVETLVRQRGDINDSAVRVADLEPLFLQILAFSRDAPAGGGAVGDIVHGTLSGLSADDHVQYHTNARGDTRYPRRTELDVRLAFRSAASTGYTEFTYSGTQLTQIDIWTNISQTTKLFTRTFSYTGTQLTTAVTTDEGTGQVYTRTFGYTGPQLSTITEAIV